MDLNAELGKKMQELQILEQNMQQLSLQLQAFQIELNEIVNAESEVSRAKDDVYRVLSGIMLRADKTELLKELGEKKKILELRTQAIEKQQIILDDKMKKLRSEVTTAANQAKKK